MLKILGYTRDILLPILLFPVAIPVLIASVKASAGFLGALPLEEIMPWLNRNNFV